MGIVFNTIRLCAANIDSTDLAMPNFYWYKEFGWRKVIKEIIEILESCTVMNDFDKSRRETK